MGLFKDFKEDLSDAVDDMIGTNDQKEKDEDLMVNTIDEDVDVDSELNKLDGLLEKASKKVDDKKEIEEKDTEEGSSDLPKDVSSDYVDSNYYDDKKEGPDMDDMSFSTMDVNTNSNNISDEVAEITSGMTVKGDLDSTGSINVDGTVNGNVKCNGKLVVKGSIVGNSTANEFFADNAKIEGEVNTIGTVKIGTGSVIVGNITASSAVIAGAVKGDIDVQGPVVVDTSAVIMGNIKSRSVQINNGAVIEGFCSQAYAEVDVKSVFGEADNQ